HHVDIVFRAPPNNHFVAVHAVLFSPHPASGHVDSLIPHSLGPLRAFGPAELLSPFPKRLKSPIRWEKECFVGRKPRAALISFRLPWATIFRPFRAFI